MRWRTSEKPALSPASSPNYPAPTNHSDDYFDENSALPQSSDRRLLLRIDWHLMPFLCIMYLLAFLDRVNIGNANVYGLSKDLKLDGDKYNVALVIFFVPYILLEIPSNILLKRFKPHVWLSINMFLFGFTTVMQGIVTSYSGLLACRFFLGVFETGMFPGCFYLIGMYYRRHEAQKRYSFFFSSTTLAGAFGGLLAAAIGKMDGKAGYAGWRWIFILEGALTAVVAVFFFFLLPGFPEQAKWLSPDERAYVAARLQAEQGDNAAERKITLRDVLDVFKDYKVIVAGFIYLGLVVPAYGYAYFAPSIIKTYGYGPIETQLHSVAPWAAAFGFAMLMAFLSDWAKHRFFFTVVSMFVSIAGLGILITVHDNTQLQYAALFLVTMGTYTAMPIVVCWFNMNLGGHHRRAVGSAWQVGFGNVGGIVAVFIFLAKDSPKYIPGYSITLAFISMAVLASTLYFVSCAWENRSRDRMPRDVGPTQSENAALGDKSPEYRYLL